jgi:hypothetical protein
VTKIDIILIQWVCSVFEVEELIHLLDGGHSEGVGGGDKQIAARVKTGEM